MSNKSGLSKELSAATSDVLDSLKSVYFGIIEERKCRAREKCMVKKNSPKEHKRRMAETNIPALNRHAPTWLCTETFPSSGSFLEER